MECPFCGAEVRETAKFCEYCGKNIEDARGDDSEVKIARMKHEEEMEKLKQDALDREYEREPSTELELKYKHRETVIIWIALAVIMVALVIGNSLK